MKSFKALIIESKEHPENVHGMPRSLWEFFFHLSSPGTEEHHLHEARVFDAFSNLASKELPKSERIVKQGNEELTPGNAHKRIQGGFQKAFREMGHEDKATSRIRLRDARKTLGDFAKSRGFGLNDLFSKNNQKLRQNSDYLGQNLKLKKANEHVWIKGLSLAPHATNGLKGFDVCPNASTHCRQNCLGTETGGSKLFPDHALSSKILKTHALLMHPEHFARALDFEIGAHKRAATRQGMQPVIRLNVTSDLPWEKYAPQMFQKHSDTQFYDYTKSLNRVLNQSHPDHPKNYMLALSHTGTGHPESNDHHVIKALEAGHLVAMVHKRGKNNVSPTHVEDVQTGKRYPVVNGDNDDHLPSRFPAAGKTHMQPGHGVVTSLTLKGVSNERAGVLPTMLMMMVLSE